MKNVSLKQNECPTSLGSAMLLGSLKHYAESLEGEGLQVHCSHWVAKAHFGALSTTAKGAKVQLIRVASVN